MADTTIEVIDGVDMLRRINAPLDAYAVGTLDFLESDTVAVRPEPSKQRGTLLCEAPASLSLLAL